jgi:hypothetical protein
MARGTSATSTSIGLAERPVSRSHRLATTPGRLRLASLALALSFAALGVVGTVVLRARQGAARDVGLETAPLLVGSEDLFVALSDADATASNTFLRYGLEPAELRERYLTDVKTSGALLTKLSSQGGLSPVAREALTAIATQLPVYTGLIEQARANARQGFPVGAAYLRAASALMRDQILPQATLLYQEAARNLDGDYRSGQDSAHIAGILSAALIALSLLVLVQLYVLRRTNRVINPGLVVATLLVLAIVPWSLARVISEQTALSRARTDGSDAVQVFSTARILLLRAQSDESLTLIAAGTGNAYLRDFDATMARLGGPDGRGGLFGEASRFGGDTRAIEGLAGQFRAVLDTHRRVRELDDGGSYREAVSTFLGAESDAAAALNEGLRQQIAGAARALDSNARDARSGFTALIFALPVAVALSALAAVAGLQRRIGEYA